MNYFDRIKKSLLLVLISLFVQSCDNTCIKSNDFGEQTNVDLFKISAKDLSDCVFDEADSSSSYDKMTDGSILKKCMAGYKYDEDTNKFSEKQTDTAYSLIKAGYFDLGDMKDAFNKLEKKLDSTNANSLREKFQGYYCKDFDYLTDSGSEFIRAFKNENILSTYELTELNKKIYKECGYYCSSVCSGSLSINNSSFDAATFSQLSWPHSTLKSSGSYYGINFKDSSNFTITASGSIQTNGMSTSINANNSAIVINKNPYLPSYNLSSDSVWVVSDKANLFAKVEVPGDASSAAKDDLLSKFYLDFVNFSDTKLKSTFVPIQCDNENASSNMPNYVQKGENGNEYKGSLVFAEPKYSSVYCDYDTEKARNLCTFKADYTKLLTEIGCLKSKDEKSSDDTDTSKDTLNNTVNVEPFNNLQKNYYKYAINDLNDIPEKDKKFDLSKTNEQTKEIINKNGKIGTILTYREYTYDDSDGELVLQYTLNESNTAYTGQKEFSFANGLSIPFKVYIKSDKQDLSKGCNFKINAKNNIKNFLKKNVNNLDDTTVQNKNSDDTTAQDDNSDDTTVSDTDINYDNITISSVDTWYPVALSEKKDNKNETDTSEDSKNKIPAILNEYAIDDSRFSVEISTSDAGCFDNLTIQIVPLREIEIKQTGFLFFKNVLEENGGNEIKFQVINPDLTTIVKTIDSSKNSLLQPNINDYEKEIRANYFEYYQYNKTRATDAESIKDTFTTIKSITANNLKTIELLGKELKENIEYEKIFKENAVFVRKGQVIRFDDSNWIDTSNLSIKTKIYSKSIAASDTSSTSGTTNTENTTIANNIDLIYFIKERPALMCLSDKFIRTVNVKKICPDALANKRLYTVDENNNSVESDLYLCNVDIKKSTIDNSNENCYVYIGKDTDTEKSKFTKLQYLVIDTTDDNEQVATTTDDSEQDDSKQVAIEKTVDFKNGNDDKTNYINVAEAFNITLQHLYSITDFLTVGNKHLNKAISLLSDYKKAIGELRTKFGSCLLGSINSTDSTSSTNSNIFVVKSVEYERTETIGSGSESDQGNSETTIKQTNIGYREISKNDLNNYLENIEKNLDDTLLTKDPSLLKKAIESEKKINSTSEDNSGDKSENKDKNKKTAKEIAKEICEDLNADNKIPFTVNLIDDSTTKIELDCKKQFPKYEEKGSDDEKRFKVCNEAKDSKQLVVSFNLTLFDNLEDDGCYNMKKGLCRQKLTTCLNFSNYFGSVYNFNDLISMANEDDVKAAEDGTKADDKDKYSKKFNYDINFATDTRNIISGFNIGGAQKNGGDLTTFETSNKYDEENDKENVIICSNGAASDTAGCYNKYKMTDIIVSDKVFPRLLDLNRHFLFPNDPATVDTGTGISTQSSGTGANTTSTVITGQKTLSFKVTSQDKKSAGENLAVFVGSADELYGISDQGKLCVASKGKQCEKEAENDVFWLVGYDNLAPKDNSKLVLKENNPFKFNVGGQLVKVKDNNSVIGVNDIINDNLRANNSINDGYNLAFFFKILDEDGDDANNSGFYTIKITELSNSSMQSVIQTWFQRRQALNDSSINFKLDEPVGVVNLLFNSILGIMDGESYGIRSDLRKCDKTLNELKETEEICFIHDYSKNDSLNGKSCGTDGIEGYSDSVKIAERYCFKSCDQIANNEVNVSCKVVYNNGGLLKLLYINIIQNTLYQFIVKLALVLMLTLYGFGYFLGLSEFNQKEIMTRILRACFIYALISNTGWALYDKFVVSFFKQGIDSLLFLIASSFEAGENNYIEQAILQNDYSVKMLLFSSTFNNIKMLFSEAVLYKILGLIFSGWLGILYAYLVLTGLITYIVGMFNAIALYLMAQMFMSITLSIGPMIFLLMFFERTKGSFDNWLSILIGFALQEIFIIITVSFFNNLITSIIKTVFAYPVCILPILDINLLGVPLSILQFWKIPGTGFSGNILDVQNQAGPSFYSILLFYIVANLSNKFVTEMADLGNDIGDGIKATDIASTMTNAISTAGNKMNGVIGGVASAPYTRTVTGFNNFVKREGDKARESMQTRFNALNEARVSPIKNDIKRQLKQGNYKDEKLQNLYNKMQDSSLSEDERKATEKDYNKAFDGAVGNERMDKLMKNESLDKAVKEYYKKKGINIDEKDESGKDKFTPDQKREFKEYFLGEQSYIQKDGSMEGHRRVVVSDFVAASKQMERMSGSLKKWKGKGKLAQLHNAKLQEVQDKYDNASKALNKNPVEQDAVGGTKGKQNPAPTNTEVQEEQKPALTDAKAQEERNLNKPDEKQPQDPAERPVQDTINGTGTASTASEQTVDRGAPQNTQASEGITRNPASEGE